MTSVVASAPGKIVLFGEYAVLDGAPAVSMAVNRRAVVTVRNITGESGRLRCPGFCEREIEFSYDENGRVRFPADAPDLRLFQAAWASSEQRSADITLDSSKFFDAITGRKLGIGSSAALLVALLAATNQNDDDTAFAMHRELQDGRGSGVDVATAIRGGVIAYRMHAAVEPLEWPEGLDFRVLWSGRSATTSSRVRSFLDNENRDTLVAPLRAASESALAQWRTAPLEGLANYAAALWQFSDAAGLDIYGAGHDALYDLAASMDLVYKPSGAGGGDIGVVFGQDQQALDRFATDSGFQQIELALESVGVSCQQEKEQHRA